MELDAPDGIILSFHAGYESESVIIFRRGSDVVELVQSRGREVLRRQALDVEIRSGWSVGQRVQYLLPSVAIQSTRIGTCNSRFHHY